MAKLLIEMEPDIYEPCAIKNRKLVVYMKVLKVLQGTLKAANYFWEKFSTKLQKWEFTINPYDAYVLNKMVSENDVLLPSMSMI